MNRYVLRRDTETGARTIRTGKPHEVMAWLWESLDQRLTLSVTISVEDVPRPEPKPKPQCEGQRTIADELPNLRPAEWCQRCGFAQCPSVGTRPVGCRLR